MPKMKNNMVHMNMKMMVGGHTESSKYLEVWSDSPVNRGCVTFSDRNDTPQATSAPSAPRHWEAPQAAPTAACQDPCPKPQTDGSARGFLP